jgi:hypothetical protein
VSELRRTRWLSAFLLLGSVPALLGGCNGTGIRYYTAYVDRVEPTIPGLVVTGGTSSIYIENNTGVDVYVYDSQGEDVLRLTPTECFIRRGQDWTGPHPWNHFNYPGYPVEYSAGATNQPHGRYAGQVMREWVVEGRVGETPFKIYGRTVYTPPK